MAETELPTSERVDGPATSKSTVRRRIWCKGGIPVRHTTLANKVAETSPLTPGWVEPGGANPDPRPTGAVVTMTLSR